MTNQPNIDTSMYKNVYISYICYFIFNLLIDKLAALRTNLNVI